MNLERLMVAEVRRNLAKGGRPQIPPGGELLWRWFTDLAATRRWTMAGPEPITFAEIDAYACVSGWPIEPRHAAIIRAMDEAFVKHAVEQRTKGQGSGAAPMVASRPMTGALFDSLFGG